MSKAVNVSTYIAPFTRLGTPEIVIDTLKESGFRAFDFTMMFPIQGFDLLFDSEDYLEKAKELKKYADLRGLSCNQTHGSVPCFRSGVGEEENKELRKKVIRTIEISGLLGAKYCVLHPASDCSMKDNISFFKSIADVAHKNNVIIAIENTLSDVLFGKPEDFITLLDSINDDSFKVCLDIGHAETKNTNSCAIDFVEKLGDRIVCLHIHDNDKNSDLHQLPYSFLVQFDEIFQTLKRYKYKGDITFECGSFFNNMPISLFKNSLTFLYSIGEYISKLIAD